MGNIFKPRTSLFREGRVLWNEAQEKTDSVQTAPSEDQDDVSAGKTLALIRGFAGLINTTLLTPGARAIVDLLKLPERAFWDTIRLYIGQEANHMPGELPGGRRGRGVFVRRAVPLAGAATVAVLSPSTAEAQQNETERIALAQETIDRAKVLRDLIGELSPSTGNKISLGVILGWFGVALVRSLSPAGFKKATHLGSNFIDQNIAFTPTSGIGMVAAAFARNVQLSSGNDFDKEMAHHEFDELTGSMYLVAVMSALAHIAETGIQVSPEIDQILKERTLGLFNVLSGGWRLDETQNRPSAEANKEVLQAHFEAAEHDMIKACGDLLTYGGATAFTVVPTVYGTSAFAANAERKLPIVAFERYYAKALLDGKDEQTAKAEAIKLTNEALVAFKKFKLSFVDNILAGFGSDGPCIPVLIHLFKNSGLKGIANYFKLMVPNISKHFAINLEVLLGSMGVKLLSVGNQSQIIAQTFGEAILNGSIVNVTLLYELGKKFLGGDKGIEKAGVHIKEIFGGTPNGEDIVEKVQEFMERNNGKMAFSFEFNIIDWINDLAHWFKDFASNNGRVLARAGEEHHLSKKHQELDLTARLHASILERYQLVLNWQSTDSDRKREIVKALMGQDPELKSRYGNETLDELMVDEKFRRFISDHLSGLMKSEGQLFQSLLKNEEGGVRYPDLSPDEHAYLINRATSQFVRSLKLGRTVVKAGYHAEAGKEVFGALAGQLAGAALGSSLCKMLLSDSVDLTSNDEAALTVALDGAFSETSEKRFEVINVLEGLALRQDEARGEMSPFAKVEIETAKGDLKSKIADYHKEGSDKKQGEVQVIKALASLVTKIFRIARPAEVLKKMLLIYAAGGVMTPIADNIAAALFVISTEEGLMDEVFGEGILHKLVMVPVVPGLPLEIEMPVGDVLTILAGMACINLGNGTLYGNGVQLGEVFRQIKGVNSNNIGDLEIEETPALDHIGKFTMLTNMYALIPDLWTLADVAYCLHRVIGQLNPQKV